MLRSRRGPALLIHKIIGRESIAVLRSRRVPAVPVRAWIQALMAGRADGRQVRDLNWAVPGEFAHRGVFWWRTAAVAFLWQLRLPPPPHEASVKAYLACPILTCAYLACAILPCAYLACPILPCAYLACPCRPCCPHDPHRPPTHGSCPTPSLPHVEAAAPPLSRGDAGGARQKRRVTEIVVCSLLARTPAPRQPARGAGRVCGTGG